ncbi:4Fe-4S binding protein [Deferrisoma camini]|uniref:4Fe-4S binding protein n=1 Tax=Deferrisoma camini TaxID=1035120 RepID=UPI00046CF242|nr:4Fe-4S binding protein [Deferrisoma camini]
MTARQRRHGWIQALRRLVQIGTVCLVVGLALASLYAHYRAARALDEMRAVEGPVGSGLRVVDRLVSGLDDPRAFLDGFKGSLWSMRLAGWDVTDPLAALEVIATSKVLHPPLLLAAAVPVLLALLLGRVFCSWVCPGYLLFEAGGKLRRLLRWVELPPAEVRFSYRNKYLFLAVGLVVAAITARPLFALIYPPAVVSRLVHAWVFGTALTGMLVVLGLILAFEVFVSPRWFCRSLCPGGALLGVLGRGRPVRVRLEPHRCTHCRRCEPVCEQGLNPVTESSGMECDNCGRCVRACPEDALAYRVGIQRMRSSDGPGRAGSLAAALFWGALALAVLAPTPARAHHILGLPHYSYKENYPQVPTLEYPASAGPYDVLLTSYPGKPPPGEPANLAFYIKNRATGEPYGQPVTVRVLQTFTFGRNRELQPPIRIEPFDRVHKLTVTFDREGEYVVELAMEVEGRSEVIPFRMVVGDPSSAASVLAAVGGGLAVFLIGVRAVRIKRRRRQAQEAGA